jgi:hypothetical protein
MIGKEIEIAATALAMRALDLPKAIKVMTNKVIFDCKDGSADQWSIRNRPGFDLSL